AVAINGRVVVFVRGTDGAIYYQHSSGGAFSGWISLGGGTNFDPMTKVQGSTLFVEVIGTDGNRYYKQSNDGVNFSNWTIGTVGATTIAAAGLNNIVYTFVRGSSSQSHLCVTTLNIITPTPTPTATPTPTPTVTPTPTPGGTPDPVTGCSAGFSSLGGVINSDPSAAIFANRVFVFARGTDGAIYYQTSTGGAFSGWNSLGGISTTNPMTFMTQTGIGVQVGGTDGNIYQRITTDGINFSNWTVGVTPGATTVPTVSLGGNLYTFTKGASSSPHLCLRIQ
ncbi:MAG TPA: hypothetical protein PKY82_17690, partial [Pyrinomonadaceae bacterium]|nr:hypothetical protein [Pyrinomonadaceae bacterium]